MVMREISLYLLLGHLLMAGIASVCVPVKCLKCNVTTEAPAVSCSLCSNNSGQCVDVPPESHCNTTDFQVSVKGPEEVQEGDDITITCDTNLPLIVTFGWKKDKKEFPEGQNKSELALKKVLSDDSGQYTCSVNSSCGFYESPPHTVSIPNNSLLILVICGVSALALVVVMGLVMKFKLKRDNAKNKERMKQRAQVAQRGGPAPFTPRES